MGLRSAVAINVASMIGAGPLITIPLVVVALHGSVSVAAWIAGALVSLCDGMVNAELASRFPRSGGTYAYLREAFGPTRWGSLAAFLFVWQFFFSIPLTLASGYIGFAQYAAYLVPAAAQPFPQHLIAIVVGLTVIVALYRPIPAIARTALVLGAIALATILAIALAGLTHPVTNVATLLPRAFTFGGFGIAAFGAALVITLYDYAGYNSITEIGDEVVAPVRTMPRAILLSVTFVAVAYILLNIGIFSALPIADIGTSSSVASLVVERALGHAAAVAVTIAVLLTAFASTYGLLLGASRIPYAAARDGLFLEPFARLHPTMKFPYISLLVIGVIALPASLFPLDAVINALTAGIVLIAGVGSAVAVAALRRTSEPAPFRSPFFPLPALIAGAAWLFLFVSTGSIAMIFGSATLAVGGIVFLIRSRLMRRWPFAAMAGVALWTVLCGPNPASAKSTRYTFDHAQVVQRDGYPELLVDGNPFFFFGGAFFYERINPDTWQQSMDAMRQIGVNTLDLYIPWNWHELSDGEFDFDGHSNPRRNLQRVLSMAREHGFHIVVRPGPVIRNEWRNGGYPAWLLQRPEYGMSLHDILEGRYPATATLQNAHSDDAAAEWMRNTTHRFYASRWLHRALSEFQPYADLVIAVQLDDDQAAYIDNQTWPAPNLQRYLRWLDGEVRDVVGPTVPTFINTYDMKVPASSPVWAMGNWYQSDAYSIADHDRQELDFTTATLTTQPRFPLAYSEFQAGWLASPEDPLPRAADPTNTTLALGELLSWGAHGIIDFPVQDTLAPFGWEAPFSNALYAWDAALPAETTLQVQEPARRVPTAAFGSTIDVYGSALATTHRLADIAIIYGLSAVDPKRLTPSNTATLVASFREVLHECSERHLSCNVVDLRYTPTADLEAYKMIVVPPLALPLEPRQASIVVQLQKRGRIARSLPAQRRQDEPVVLTGRDGSFAIFSNWSQTPRVESGDVTVNGTTFHLGSITLAPRSSMTVPIDVAFPLLGIHQPQRRLSTTCRVFRSIGVLKVYVTDACRLLVDDSGTTTRIGSNRPGLYFLESLQQQLFFGGPETSHRPTYYGGPSLRATYLNSTVPMRLTTNPSADANATTSEALGAGIPCVELTNRHIRAVFAPDGGARLVVFQYVDDQELGHDAVNATGALRDDVAIQQAPSKTDRIARYTHSYPAGMFNRPYRVEILQRGGMTAQVRFSYIAPDLVGGVGKFEKTVTLDRDSTRLIVDERFIPFEQNGGIHQHLVSLSALAVTDTDFTPIIDYLGLYAIHNGVAIHIGWDYRDVETSTWTQYRSTGTLALTTTDKPIRLVYALKPVADATAGGQFVNEERSWLGDHPTATPSP